MIEVLPTTCRIDSSLGSLADALDLTIVERDTAAPVTPVAQAWRTLTQGDLIRVRLGLEGLGYDDYGVFRVDESVLETTESEWVTTIRARDQAALLIEERAEESYGFGVWGRDNPAEKTYPSAASLAAELCGAVGLELAWDVPSYTLKSFTIGPEESLSSALGRVLDPLRASRRYYADAWADGERLVVRRRGRGAVAGTLDCRQGMVRGIRRARQPSVGAIDVYGDTITWLTVRDWTEQAKGVGAGESGEGGPDVSVRAEENAEGTHRVVETGTKSGDVFVTMTRETEDLTYQDVYGDGDPAPWLGRVQTRSVVLSEGNLHTENPTQERKTCSFAYDDQWRLVLRAEQTERHSETEGWQNSKQLVARYEQITPTDVRTTTEEMTWSSADQQWRMRSGYPKWEQAAGTLQSSIRQQQAPDNRWEQKPDGSTPGAPRVTEYKQQAHGSSSGAGSIPRVYRNDQISGTLAEANAVCQTIAQDLAAESGAWLYAISLSWPRPFPWRKGQRLTLTNLPGGCPDLTAIILRLATAFDEQQAVWMHDVELECWRDE